MLKRRHTQGDVLISSTREEHERRNKDILWLVTVNEFHTLESRNEWEYL